MGSPSSGPVGMDPMQYALTTMMSHETGETYEKDGKIWHKTDPGFTDALRKELQMQREANGGTNLTSTQFAEVVNRADSLYTTSYYDDMEKQQTAQQEAIQQQQQQEEEKKNIPADVPGTVEPVQKTPTGVQRNKEQTAIGGTQTGSGMAGSILHIKGGGGGSSEPGGGVLDPTSAKKNKNKTLG